MDNDALYLIDDRLDKIIIQTIKKINIMLENTITPEAKFITPNTKNTIDKTKDTTDNIKDSTDNTKNTADNTKDTITLPKIVIENIKMNQMKQLKTCKQHLKVFLVKNL